MIVWPRPWGGCFRFVFVEAERRAYCLADRGNGEMTFYLANVLPWIDTRTTGDHARDAWAAVLARLGEAS